LVTHSYSSSFTLTRVLLATRPRRDLGAAHFRALWDVSRLTEQKKNHHAAPIDHHSLRYHQQTQPPAAFRGTAVSTPPTASRSFPNAISQPSIKTWSRGAGRPLGEAPSQGHLHQTRRSGTVPARQHRHCPGPHRNRRANDSSGRMNGKVIHLRESA
jgi:hypothetical protein